MKVVATSDLHQQHHKVTIPRCDLLICAGDVCNMGSAEEFIQFAKWFRKQPGDVKLFVPGNHDVCVSRAPRQWVEELLGPHAHLLIDDTIEVNGLRIFGQPWIPAIGFWAFMHERGSVEMTAARNLIPEDLDILITHSPPYGLCDDERWAHGAPPENLGCASLRRRVEYVQPRYHVCGHIHGGSGERETEWGGKIINAACRVAVFEVEER